MDATIASISVKSIGMYELIESHESCTTLALCVVLDKKN